jgi:hypothetical protein
MDGIVDSSFRQTYEIGYGYRRLLEFELYDKLAFAGGNLSI